MFGKPEAYAFGPVGKSETSAGLLCSGRTEAAFAARARFKVGHEFKLGLHDRQHDELCKPLEGFSFPAKELLKGGKLSLEMGPEPNRAWGVGR